MGRLTDVRIAGIRLHFLPYRLRDPLKFGRETVSAGECARVGISVVSAKGATAGWGEAPLSPAWAWPSGLPLERRSSEMRGLCSDIAAAWLSLGESGHALELGRLFLDEVLPGLAARRGEPGGERLPWLAALDCAAAFDIALHDAYGRSVARPTFETFDDVLMSRSLAWLYGEARGSAFDGLYPGRFLSPAPERRLPVWHLVGAADRLEREGPDFEADGHPRDLRAWIRRDGLRRLKVKLVGPDPDRDFDRLGAVGRIACETGIEGIGVDFNGTVDRVSHAAELLDRLRSELPGAAERLAYVEQPFSADSCLRGVEVGAIGARTVLVLDEGAPDWRSLDLGFRLGWNAVALKACKTLTGSILSLCRAKAAGARVLVQDLTNPMLAFVPHALLAAHAGGLPGIEANAVQFCPAASEAEAAIHPALYRRSGGAISLESLAGDGLRYAGAESARALPEPAWAGEAA